MKENYTIEDLLMYAKELEASDLHLTVAVTPKVRVKGLLTNLDLDILTAERIEQLVDPLMSEHVQKLMKENGEADFAYGVSGVGRFRINLFKQRGSYALVARVVANLIQSADSLGIPASVQQLTQRKRGLVLVTGPTGSGKSTTLASLIDIINSNYNTHIITLEDPIEYLHKHKKSIVNQREIGIDTMNYAKALKGALREDPDVILVGEMRDIETISTAITAAETGHLVFSTLHTMGATNTIDRILDVFPPTQQHQIRIQLAFVLESIISQQLIPSVNQKSRVAAFEVMHMTPAAANLIRESKTHQIDSILQTGKKVGMQRMDDALVDLYLAGKISQESAVEFAMDMDSMKRRLF